MAEPRKQLEIDRCLFEHTAYNLNRIGREDNSWEIINDYFCNSNEEDDELSDLAYESDSDNPANNCDVSESTHACLIESSADNRA